MMASQELQVVLEMLKSRPVAETPPTIEEMRAGFEQMAAAFPLPGDVSTESVSAGGVPAEWVSAPGADPSRAILYLHGGGYIIGSIATHREVASRISRASGARVLVLDYRLAPECPFPAAVDDALAAYRWLLDQGLVPTRMVVAGDSAGGGLVVAALLAIRGAGLPLPAAGVCMSPWADLECSGESMSARAERDAMVQREMLVGMRDAYLAGKDARDPLASPLYADLSGLPPLLVQVGTAEVLYDDSTRLAERARAAGVEVTLEPWEDMPHVFQLFASMLPEGREAIEHIGEFIREKTGAEAAAGA
jgi:monoterpene epsilon-lactone hydrolase